MIKFSFSGDRYQTERVIGDMTGDQAGHTVVLIGGVHGNEPSGVVAIQHVFDELDANQTNIRGRIIGFAGNLGALSRNERFISKDLNRIWDHSFLENFRNRQTIPVLTGEPDSLRPDSSRPDSSRPEGFPPLSAASPESGATPVSESVAEFQEQCELFEIIEPLLNSENPLVFADLHTTSARSVPFLAINDQIANRNLAMQFPVPTVLGIEEYIDGPLLSYINEFGHTALAFEAGQHDDPVSVEIHTSFIYLALLASGSIQESDIPDLESHRARLETYGRSIAGCFEVIHRQAISPDDGFVMEPGFENLAPIQKDQLLARDRTGEIRAPRKGRIFMPLYQNSGQDGFFIVRRVPKWALTLSAGLRKINFERALTWLPGVHREPGHPGAIFVNRKVARFLATELFHLLGYRRKKNYGDVLIFSRREIDF